MTPLLIALLSTQTSMDSALIERTLAAELEETRTPGAALVLVQGGEVVFSKGFGVANVETGEPATPDHLFRIGSTTKLLTALALVKLAGEGKIDLDRPVGDVVSGLNAPFSRLTAHQLLSHTAGLKDQGADYGLHDESALGAWVRGWDDSYHLAKPGRVFSYSNPGYALAGLLLEEASGKAYADAMKELLLDPLGMSRSTFRPTEAMTYPLSQGHEETEDGKLVVVRPYSDDARQWPNGFLFASASDMARLAVALLGGGLPESVSTPHAEIPYDLPDMKRPRYGYGLFLHESRGVRFLEHAGTMPGFTSVLQLAPEERVAMILLANREGVMFEKTREAVFSNFAKGEGAGVEEPDSVPMTESEMDAFVGVYRNRWPVEIVKKDRTLFLRQGPAEWPIRRTGRDLFTAQAPRPPGGIPFRLLTGPEGRAELLQMFLWAFRREEGPS